MHYNRSAKLYFTEFLTTKKEEQLLLFLQEYSKIVNYFIEKYNTLIPQTREFTFLTKAYITLCKTTTNTWLTSRSIQCAFSEGYGMVKSYQSNLKLNPKHQLPKHYGKSATLSANLNTQAEKVETKAFDFNLTLTSLGNKLKISIPLHKHRQFNKWNSLGKRATTIILTKQYIQFSFEIATDKKKERTKCVGIDTGIVNLATTNTEHFYGSDLTRLLNKVNNKITGSKNKKQAIQELKAYIDVVAKEVFAKENPDLIVVEKLNNIGYKTKQENKLNKTVRKLIGSWNYAYWLKRLEQHCEENRVSFRSVPSYYTSQRCSNCDHTDKKNRLSQSIFKCVNCGFQGHADHNASVNILNLFLRGEYGPSLEKTNSLPVIL